MAALGTLGLQSEPPGQFVLQMLLEVGICGFRENQCFLTVKRFILRVRAAGVLQMGIFGRTLEAPGARSDVPGALCGHANFKVDFCVPFGRVGARGEGGGGLEAAT